MRKIISIVLSVILLVSAYSFPASAALRKLDLAFVIDTTGSMSDDIYTVKRNMKNYLEDLKDSGMDFRIAIVDYRDFSSRTGYSKDYPYSVQLDFTSNEDSILTAINGLSLGNGGDQPETVCSALIDGLSKLSWRSTAGRSAILMGDAPALDPEPITGYTKDMAIDKLNHGKTALEDKTSSAAKMASGSADIQAVSGGITLFTIATSSYAESSFKYLAEGTGGKSYTAYSSSQITDVIDEIIDTIPEVVEAPTFWQRLARFFKVIWYAITFQWSKI